MEVVLKIGMSDPCAPPGPRACRPRRWWCRGAASTARLKPDACARGRDPLNTALRSGLVPPHPAEGERAAEDSSAERGELGSAQEQVDRVRRSAPWSREFDLRVAGLRGPDDALTLQDPTDLLGDRHEVWAWLPSHDSDHDLPMAWQAFSMAST